MKTGSAGLFYKIRTIETLGVLMVVFTLLIGYYCHYLYRSNYREMNTLLHRQVAINTALQRLHENTGYGGFIHNFKNLVLRRDIHRYQKAIEKNIIQLQQAFDQLDKVIDSSSAKAELGVVRDTFSLYFRNYILALELIEKGSSPAEIDEMVKVDDGPALSAINLLVSGINDRLLQSRVSLEKNRREITIALEMIVLLLTLFIIVAVLYIRNNLRQIYAVSNEMHEQKKIAEQANQAKSRFISSMTHELRTPLNAILGFAQLIEFDAKDEKTRDSAHEIVSAGKHLLELINQVLDVARIEAGAVEFEIGACDLTRVVEQCIMMLQPLVDKKTIKINNKISPETCALVSADKLRLKQVILNLLSNAVKYNNDKGTVTIECSRHGDLVRLSFIDTGQGLTIEQQTHLFRPFDRAGAEGSLVAGTGLGLVTVKDLMENMQGAIGYESIYGQGSCFWIDIPVYRTAGRK